MSKKGILLFTTMLVVVVVFTAQAVFATTKIVDSNAIDNQAGAVAVSTAVAVTTPGADEIVPDSVDVAAPPAKYQGFYVENGIFKTPLDPEELSAVGSFRFWAWSELEVSRNNYNWERLDSWVQDQLDAGYESVGFAIYTYAGRQTACPYSGWEITPEYVLVGPDGEYGTEDDARILMPEPDSRACEGDTDDSWYVVDYMNVYYRNMYSNFIHALADHLLNSAYSDSIAWVATGIGQDGENRAADNRDGVGYDENYLFSGSGAGWDIYGDWESYVKWAIDEHVDAFYSGGGFPKKFPVITQNATHPALGGSGPLVRRSVADYASSRRIGLSINGMRPDYNTVEKCDHPDPNKWCTGMYDQARQFNDNVPISFESYSYMMRTSNEFYWSVARSLDFPGDYFRLSSFWDSQNNPDNRTIAQWGAKYMGTGFRSGEEEPTSIWSMMREHRNPCFFWGNGNIVACDDWPTNGNYEFYLTQVHSAEAGGLTIPVTDDPRINNSGWSGVMDKSWHYNASPYSQIVSDAGLWHITNETGPQIAVDPGWVTRMSDQIHQQDKFIFDADDRYFSRSGAPAESTFKVIITITYLDIGTDSWHLVADRVGGPYEPVEVHSINDWTVAAGMALSGGAPGTGKLPPNTLEVQKTNSNKWKVATFLIEDVNFDNLLLGGKADFYIDSRSAGGVRDGDEYIHLVDVQKVDEIIEVTPTPTFTPTPTTTPTPTVTPTPTMTPTATPTVGNIGGIVFIDVNNNGQFDEGDEGLPEALLVLSGPGSYETESDDDGNYDFTDLAPGGYMLTVTTPPGYNDVTPSSIFVPVEANTTRNINFRHDPIPTPTPTPTLTPTPPIVNLYLPLMQVPDSN